MAIHSYFLAAAELASPLCGGLKQSSPKAPKNAHSLSAKGGIKELPFCDDRK